MHGEERAHATSVCKRILGVQPGSWMTDLSVRGAEAAPSSNASISEGGDSSDCFRVFCV